jgi:hypothetical protein
MISFVSDASFQISAPARSQACLVQNLPSHPKGNTAHKRLTMYCSQQVIGCRMESPSMQDVKTLFDNHYTDEESKVKL